MRRNTLWAVVLMASALTASPAGAMPIAQYDRMSSEDQSRYTILLMTRTIVYLYAQGRNEDAAKLTRIYNGDEETGQMMIDDNLDTARARQRETGKGLDVEYAVSGALDDMDIAVSPSVLTMLVPDFKPER